KPRANAVIAMDPSTKLWDCAIQANIPHRNGPVHGAAIGPHTRPSTKAPMYPAPPAVARRFFQLLGMSRSNAPNMLAANAKKSRLIPPTTQALERIEPNVFPVNAALTPRGTNIHTNPRTKAPERASDCRRLLASVAPNTLT